MRLRATMSAMFASLENSNFRRYFFGQALSLIGTWMQVVAQSWIVLTMTGSSVAVGIVVALQTAPVLLLAPYGGVVADRADKRKLALGLLMVFSAARFWEVCALALLLGLNRSFEVPTRQSFILEMVGRDSVRNAIRLNLVIVNSAPAIGPAIAGFLIAIVGGGGLLPDQVRQLRCGHLLAVLDGRAAAASLRAGAPARGQLRDRVAQV